LLRFGCYNDSILDQERHGSPMLCAQGWLWAGCGFDTWSKIQEGIPA
jgi:hypothetical protein